MAFAFGHRYGKITEAIEIEAGLLSSAQGGPGKPAQFKDSNIPTMSHPLIRGCKKRVSG
jgi:hypothetical protein